MRETGLPLRGENASLFWRVCVPFPAATLWRRRQRGRLGFTAALRRLRRGGGGGESVRGRYRGGVGFPASEQEGKRRFISEKPRLARKQFRPVSNWAESRSCFARLKPSLCSSLYFCSFAFGVALFFFCFCYCFYPDGYLKKAFSACTAVRSFPGPLCGFEPNTYSRSHTDRLLEFPLFYTFSAFLGRHDVVCFFVLGLWVASLSTSSFTLCQKPWRTMLQSSLRATDVCRLFALGFSFSIPP